MGQGLDLQHMHWKWILGIPWRCLWVTRFTEALGAANHFFRMFILTRRVMDGWSLWQWDVPGRHHSEDPQLPPESPFPLMELQVHPSEALAQAQRLRGRCLKVDWREESGGNPLPPTIPGAAIVLFILLNWLSNDRSFEKKKKVEFHPLTNWEEFGDPLG